MIDLGVEVIDPFLSALLQGAVEFPLGTGE
jgi:hypothetical protein